MVFAKMAHSILLENILTKQGNSLYYAQLRQFPFPSGWNRLQSPLSHLDSYNLQEHARLPLQQATRSPSPAVGNQVQGSRDVQMFILDFTTLNSLGGRLSHNRSSFFTSYLFWFNRIVAGDMHGAALCQVIDVFLAYSVIGNDAWFVDNLIY